MSTQVLATVVTMKLGSLSWSRSNNYSMSGARALRLVSPAQPRGGVAGKWSAAASATSAPVPPEQVEAIRSLNGWVAENMLPLLTPVESAWQPHDYLPRSAAAEPGASKAFTEELAELRAAAACLPDDVLVCLVGNMVTEEVLPTYQSMFNVDTGASTSTLPWARWIRGWTAEENRHSDLLNRYLYLTGRVDMRQVEVTIHHLLRNGMAEMPMPARSPYHSLIYGAFQERAAFISHGHTARLAVQHGDRTLSRICGVVAADERRHEDAYTRASAELFGVDPDGMVLALAYVVRGKVILMSDGGLGGGGDGDSLFARFSAVAQRAGVYTASDYGDLVEHFVRQWGVADLGAGLSGEGRRAQEYVCGLAPKIRRMEERAHRRAARGEPGLAQFSWMLNRNVVVG